jgi:hypothetical protein
VTRGLPTLGGASRLCPIHLTIFLDEWARMQSRAHCGSSSAAAGFECPVSEIHKKKKTAILSERGPERFSVRGGERRICICSFARLAKNFGRRVLVLLEVLNFALMLFGRLER